MNKSQVTSFPKTKQNQNPTFYNRGCAQLYPYQEKNEQNEIHLNTHSIDDITRLNLIVKVLDKDLSNLDEINYIGYNFSDLNCFTQRDSG